MQKEYVYYKLNYNALLFSGLSAAHKALKVEKAAEEQ